MRVFLARELLVLIATALLATLFEANVLGRTRKHLGDCRQRTLQAIGGQCGVDAGRRAIFLYQHIAPVRVVHIDCQSKLRHIRVIDTEHADVFGRRPFVQRFEVLFQAIAKGADIHAWLLFRQAEGGFGCRLLSPRIDRRCGFVRVGFMLGFLWAC